MNVEDDRLSSLPDDVIHKILSFVGIKHAIQTSVLSSRWRFIWTSMPYLDFSRDDFSTLAKVSTFVTNVLSYRNNQTEVSSVSLSFHGEHGDAFVKQITEYAFSHNVQKLNVACFLWNDVDFPLFSSQSLKHLSLTNENVSRLRRCSSYVIKAASTLELPTLTTLYLHNVSLCCDENADSCIDFFSKCSNLKNLTLKNCSTNGFKGLSICLPMLCSLTLKDVCGSVMVFNVMAPQLKSLTISSFLLDQKYLISAPDLTFLLYKGFECFELSSDDFLSLEKADVCVSYPTHRDAHQIGCLLQQIHNAKFLTLNLEIVELLTSSVELMSHQPFPFTNLRSLHIHPASEPSRVRKHGRVEMSAEVKSYLLDSSPGATFTMVTREDIRVMNDTKFAQELITELRALLEQEKSRTETKMAKLHELQKTQVDKHNDIYKYINMRWKRLSSQIEKERVKASDISSRLKDIKHSLEGLPASNRAILQPAFSTLCAEADVVMHKLTDFMKMNCDEYQRRLSVCFHELATTLLPSS
ncbi:hypothetical protein QVD17_04184 [Tagetes erecta]|uniref:F-box domain-containing protein n=1 Tax=Tagetes erecta TaxID=13708 RepID=A0AAD8PAI2_TARER|nr:hypothetical protein QVD17_04184 [Tagetes erecta]